MLKINELYAFVVVDPKDGNEGIIGWKFGDQWMPFVGADMKRIKSLLPFAKTIASKTGVPFRILRFRVREDITAEMKK